MCIRDSINAPGYTGPADGTLREGISLVMTLVGGLISALVISVLAVTPPNEGPPSTLLRNFNANHDDVPGRWLTGLTYLYLSVWVLTGVAAVLFGVVFDYPRPVPELTAMAKAWLGLAITSVYAFFGLKR